MDLGKCVEAVYRVPGEPVQGCVCVCTCVCRRGHCEGLGWSGRYGVLKEHRCHWGIAVGEEPEAWV